MSNSIETLTNEEFKTIYTDESFRNKVAYAHGCYDSNTLFKHLKTCDYPKSKERIVSKEQKDLAVKEIETARGKKVNELMDTNTIVFIGMGMEYVERYEGDLCNHRIRAEFTNSKGKRFFIEVGTGRHEGEMRVDHSVDRDLQDKYDKKVSYYSDKWREARNSGVSISGQKVYKEGYEKYSQQLYYNYGNLERSNGRFKYTKSGLLNLINESFECHFKYLVVDNRTLTMEDAILINKSFKKI